MSSSTAVVCREVFDENSQPSVEEICEYAQQLGIDPESESHLLPLARDGLMQALPPHWKAYFDEKLQTHYYYNEETKKTQWEHPLDNVYRELVKKARDASMQDDTCASVQELLTSEENTNQRNLERHETKVESDEELTTDSENQPEIRENPMHRRLAPLGRPPLSPLSKIDKKLGELRVSPLRRSVEGLPKPSLVRNSSDKELFNRVLFEKPKLIFKQQSEIIDLKMSVTSPEEENYKPLFGSKSDRGLPLTGKGNMFLKLSKSDLPSPDTEKSLPLDSITKSDPPKGILRESVSETVSRRSDNVGRHSASFDEDKKSVRFRLENVPESTVSPGSNSSSEQNEGQSSIVSAHPTLQGGLQGALQAGPGRPPPTHTSDKDSIGSATVSGSECVSGGGSVGGSTGGSVGGSGGRRVVRPPASDYIRPQLFQKQFRKLADILAADPPQLTDTRDTLETRDVTEARPRSPMIPQTNKISINLMESIESETSIDSPDREFANLDLNDLDDSEQKQESNKIQTISNDISDHESEKQKSSTMEKINNENLKIPVIKVANLDASKSISENEDSKKSKEESKNSKTSLDISNINSPQMRVSPIPSLAQEIKSPRLNFGKPWSPLSTFKPQKAVIAPQVKASESSPSLKVSPRLDGVILSQGKAKSDNVVVVYQFENQENSLPKPIRSPLIPDMGARDFIERNKSDERRRLELALQKELESIRVEWSVRERKMRAELNEELRDAEERFMTEKRMRLNEQAERHQREMEETLAANERHHRETLESSRAELEERRRREREGAERQHARDMDTLRDTYTDKYEQLRRMMDAEHNQCLEEVRSQFSCALDRERVRLQDEHRAAVLALREHHRASLEALRHDYRAQVERVRGEHRCLAEEARRRLAAQRAVSTTDKYRALKDKYARLKHDVKMSIERRNKRREMSVTTGSETERSNSHRTQHSADRNKDRRSKAANDCCNHNNTSASDNGTKLNNNHSNNEKIQVSSQSSGAPSAPSVPSQGSAPAPAPARPRSTVAFRDPSPEHIHVEVTTDYQDSSDATTADEKPKESTNGHTRRRCFTRLKSASTSRLNCSPKWAGPLESVRQQLRALDALDALGSPDQPPYALPYPFRETVAAEGGELEFVRHRALVEREGVRRARAALRTRRAALLLHEVTTSEASSASERGAATSDVTRIPHVSSPETSSYNAVTSQTKHTSSAPSEGEGVSSRAAHLRVWLHTQP